MASAPAKTRRRFGARRIAAAIMMLGVALRAATLIIPHSFFADEIFQYLEPAHRLAFGPGVVTWEYRYAIRSWIFPLLLSLPMTLGGVIAPAGGFYLLLPKLALLLVSATTIGAGGSLGQRISALHALFAMFVSAIWFETVYFSTQALTESIAVPVFLGGATLVYRGGPPSRTIAAGLLLALAALLRFQYAPGISVFALIVCLRDLRRLPMLVMGAAIAVGASCAVDVAMGGLPFAWVFENLHQNIGLARSHMWVEGPFFYPWAMAGLWGVWIIPILGLALLGARRYPALLACAAVNLLAHSAIAHKEYRYILLTTMIVALLAGLGTADAIRWLRRRLPGTRLSRLAVSAGALWLMASGSIAAGGAIRWWWTHDAAQLEAFASLRATPALCGVALDAIEWSSTGGYAYLHRAVPLFAYKASGRATLARDAGQFNAIVAEPATPLPPGFSRAACFTDSVSGETVCTATRHGPCAPATAAAEINRSLVRIDR